MDLAIKYRVCTGENPAKGVSDAIGESKAGRVEEIDRSVPMLRRRRPFKWDVSETAAFMNFVAERRLACLWHFYATLGPRRGELIATGWWSVDGDAIAFESRLLQLAGDHPCECGQSHTGLLWLPGAKSGNGVRVVFLPTQLVTALEEHRARQAAEKAAAAEGGSPWFEHDLIFCQEDGNPLNPDSVTDMFNAIVQEMGLFKIRLHDLRHNAASLLLATGMPFANVAKLTGHDENTLKTIYHHVSRQVVTPEIQKAADFLESLRRDAAGVVQAPAPADDEATVTSLLGRVAAS